MEPKRVKNVVDKSFTGHIAVMISAAGYGTLPLFGKKCLSLGIDVTTLLLFRFAIAAVCFLGICRFVSDWKRLPIKISMRLILLGALPYASATAFYLASVRFIPASIAVMLVFLYPLWVTLITAFLEKEPLTLKKMIPVAMAVIGAGLMAGWSDGELPSTGLIFGLMAGVCFGTFIALSKRAVAGIPANQASFLVSLGAAISSVIGSLIFSKFSFPTVEALPPLLSLIVISTVIPILAFLYGIRFVSPPKAAILSTLEPVVTILLSILLLNETATSFQLIGGGLILLSIVSVEAGLP